MYITKIINKNKNCNCHNNNAPCICVNANPMRDINDINMTDSIDACAKCGHEYVNG